MSLLPGGAGAVLVAALIGLLAGFLAGWFVERLRGRHARVVAVAEAEARLGRLVTETREALARSEATLTSERTLAADLARTNAERATEWRSRIAGLEATLDETASAVSALRDRETKAATELAKEREAFAERLAVYKEAEARLGALFEALSSKALNTTTQNFLNLAAGKLAEMQAQASSDLEQRRQGLDDLLGPLKAGIDGVSAALSKVESERNQDHGRLAAQVRALDDGRLALQKETARLVQALRTPHVRGRWGEVQLRRVVEMAGMLEHCDFDLQQTVATEEGSLRPDLLVRLPGDRLIVVDAKAPVMAHLEALEAADDDARQARLREHAAQVRAHVGRLAGKHYWDQFPDSPEFVVMFLPGEAFFSAAVQQDPALLEFGAERRVFLAGPLTLLALLRTVAHGWTQERLAEHAREISALGKDLYERLCTMAEHFGDLRRKLEGAVSAYNAGANSLESRVMVSARRFKDLGVRSAKELEAVEPVSQRPRSLRASDLIGAEGVDAVDAVLIGDERHDAEPDDGDDSA
ncbi:MAG: DNA recombination protein RmuC [Acidobacteriota bacterium]